MALFHSIGRMTVARGMHVTHALRALCQCICLACSPPRDGLSRRNHFHLCLHVTYSYQEHHRRFKGKKTVVKLCYSEYCDVFEMTNGFNVLTPGKPKTK